MLARCVAVVRRGPALSGLCRGPSDEAQQALRRSLIAARQSIPTFCTKPRFATSAASTEAPVPEAATASAPADLETLAALKVDQLRLIIDREGLEVSRAVGGQARRTKLNMAEDIVAARADASDAGA